MESPERTAAAPVGAPTPPAPGWRLAANSPSLPEVHRSIPIRKEYGFWRKAFAFAGPGYLVAVGYMDPGNWATDLAGGSAARAVEIATTVATPKWVRMRHPFTFNPC